MIRKSKSAETTVKDDPKKKPEEKKRKSEVKSSPMKVDMKGIFLCC